MGTELIYQHKNQLISLNDTSSVWQEYYELTESQGTKIQATFNNESVDIIDWYNKDFGFRIVANQFNSVFFPIMTTAIPVSGILRGISEYENTYEAFRSIELPHNVYLITYAMDHILQHSTKLLNKQISISFAGWVYSLAHQQKPPIYKQNGKIVTTRGSSIFYHPPEKENDLQDYIYQFYVEEVNSWLWNNSLIIYKIKTTFFRLPGITVPIVLYATERVLQENYIPKVGDDIMGILWLVSQIT